LIGDDGKREENGKGGDQMEEEEARHTHYYPFPLLHLLPSFRELPKQTTEARRGEKLTEPHALH
jgi:hypothetical protein